MRTITGMPGRNTLRRQVERSVVVAVVDRVFEASGRACLACTDPETGAHWSCIALPSGGGGAKRFVVDGPETSPIGPGIGGAAVSGSEVQAILAVYGPGLRRAHVIGFVQHESLGLVETTVAPIGNTDKSRAVGVRDHARANGGGLDVLDERGAWTVDVTESTDGNARVQLPVSGVLRVSRGGSASGRLVLSGPLLDYLGILETYLAALEVRVNAGLTGAGSSLAPADPVTAAPTADASLECAAIHVSADDEGGIP